LNICDLTIKRGAQQICKDFLDWGLDKIGGLKKKDGIDAVVQLLVVKELGGLVHQRTRTLNYYLLPIG